MRRLSTLLAVFVTLVTPLVAHAGGSNVSVAAGQRHVWVGTGIDVVELDARTGRVERRYLTRFPFTLGLGLGRDGVWVSSVEDGFVAGAVTRISLERGPVAHPLVLLTRPVLSLAVGGGTTWALIGPWASTELAAIDQASGRVTYEPIHRVGWIAADDTGRTPGLYAVTTSGRAMRVATRDAPAWTASTGRIESPPAVGLGSVWVASRGGLYRLDAATGHTQAVVPLESDGAFLTLGDGRIWVASFHEAAGSERYELLELDPEHDRVVARASLDGPVGAIAYGNGALWIAQAGASVTLLRVDPRSLKARSFATGLDTVVPSRGG